MFGENSYKKKLEDAERRGDKKPSMLADFIESDLFDDWCGLDRKDKAEQIRKDDEVNSDE